MTKLIWIALLLALTSCVRVRAYNQRVYDQCVQQHHGETWTWNGLPMTCAALPYPSCEQTLEGKVCR